MDQFNWYMDNDDLEMQNSKQASADINIDTDLDLQYQLIPYILIKIP